MNKNKRVSVVVPVYNEEESLAACLEAIAKQTVQPHEVIVVDNNSTDNTVAVALRFPFVRVLHEPHQGVVYARTTGFDAARGDIIGRLDADSRPGRQWVATLQKLFAEEAGLQAVTGRVRYYNLALSWLLDSVDYRVRKRLARLLGREVAMQGANMALRRSAWLQVRGALCYEGDMHEDYDLAIHLAATGQHIAFNEKLEVAIGFRQAETNWFNFCRYAWASPKTYAKHGLKSRRHMYPVVALVIIAYPLLKVLHKGFDSTTGHFSWSHLFAEAPPARVNPATFVD
jgi:glycosyltransferase involved in cell wall biosynthesis